MDNELTIKEVSNLLQCTKQSILKNIKKGKFPNAYRRPCPKGGRGGEEWVIPITDLPVDAQAEYFNQKPDVLDPEEEVLSEERKAALEREAHASEGDKEFRDAKEEFLMAIRSYKNKKEAIKAFEAGQLHVSQKAREKIKCRSVSTLNRWDKRLRDGGRANLLSRYGNRRGEWSLKEVQDLIIARLMRKPRTKPARLVQYLERYFHKKGLKRRVGRRAVERFVRNFKLENKKLYAFCLDQNRYRGQYRSSLGKSDLGISYVNQIWQIDETVADFVCPDGRRPRLMALICVFTRRVIFLVAENCNSLAVSALIRRGLLEFGIPDIVVHDQGKAFISTHLKSIYSAFDSDNVPLPGCSPHLKGIVERIIKTVTHELLEELPPCPGHNVAEAQALRSPYHRGGKPIETSLSLEDLQTFLNSWAKNIYEQRPHRGLGGISPIQKVGQSEKPARRISKEDERLLDILLAPIAFRIVGKQGIAFKNRQYWAKELMYLIGQSVEIRLDLTDPRKIYVFTRDDKREFVCIAEDLELVRPGREERAKLHQEEARTMRQEKRNRSQHDHLPTMQETLEDPNRPKILRFERVEKADLSFPEERKALQVRDGMPLEAEPDQEICHSMAYIEPGDEPRVYAQLIKEQRTRPLEQEEKNWIANYETKKK